MIVIFLVAGLQHLLQIIFFSSIWQGHIHRPVRENTFSTPMSDSMISFTCEFVEWFTKLTIRKKQKGDKLKEKRGWHWKSDNCRGGSFSHTKCSTCVCFNSDSSDICVKSVGNTSVNKESRSTRKHTRGDDGAFSGDWV